MSYYFSEEQLDYIQCSLNENVFLEACPGAGKTEVISYKAAREFDQWRSRTTGIAILSFANSASNELSSRIAKYSSYGLRAYPHFIGTFDSFIFKNIVSPLAYQLTGFLDEDGDSTLRIIDPSSQLGYRTKYSYAKRGQVHAHRFSVTIEDEIVFDTGDTALNRELQKIDLEDWQKKDFIDTKARMLQSGLLTYRDVENLSLLALVKDEFDEYISLLSQRYPLIIIDECQDLSEEQLLILEALIDKGTNLHLIGDMSQAIYGFRDVDPSKVIEFIDSNKFSLKKLTNNYRSCQNIVNLCSRLTDRKDIGGTWSSLEKNCLVIQYEKCPTEVIRVLEEKYSALEKCVIVARGHSVLSKFLASNNDVNNIQKLALSVKCFDVENFSSLNDSIKLFSEFLQHHIKESSRANSFNCPQSIVSNLKWRLFLYNALVHLIDSGLNNFDRTWSAWIKDAKALIRSISSEQFCKDLEYPAIEALSEVNLTSPSGKAKEQVSAFLKNTSKDTSFFERSTIHGAKGETHDVTVLVSSDKKGGVPGSHWSSWIADPKSEAARFGYVASSRPRYYLIWVVKRLKEEDKSQLEEIGFSLE